MGPDRAVYPISEYAGGERETDDAHVKAEAARWWQRAQRGAGQTRHMPSREHGLFLRADPGDAVDAGEEASPRPRRDKAAHALELTCFTCFACTLNMKDSGWAMMASSLVEGR